jgi:Zinc dependent phospholipase C
MFINLSNEDKMKNVLLLFLIFVTVLVVQLSPAAAWSLPTHYEIVEKTYYALPADVQSKLSLEIMIKGARDPDLKFLDYQYHKYPENQAKVDYWLKRGNLDYKNGNYDDASYSFGVASHYISDGCCAPHSVTKASPYYHFIYEISALLLAPKINKSGGDINLIMKNNYLDGKDSWKSWIKSKNDIYVQNDLNRAVDTCFTAINESVS